MLISDRADFKARKVMQDKEGHYIMTKGKVRSPGRHTVLNMYVPNNRASRYYKAKTDRSARRNR